MIKRIKKVESSKRSLYQVFIGCLTKNGKKSVARKIVDHALDTASNTLNLTPTQVLALVASKIGSVLEVREVKVLENQVYVPRMITRERQQFVIVRTILSALTEGNVNAPMSEKLGVEFVNILKDKPCKTLSKSAQFKNLIKENRANAHFRWV